MKYNDNGLWKTLNVKVTDTLPVGTIIPYAGSTIPSNYMKCEGQELSRIEYDILFSAIGTTYGVGDGTTTFNLPNLKGRVITGIDSNDTDFDTLGETGGEKEHTLTVDEMPSHNHIFNTRMGSVASLPEGSQGAYMLAGENDNIIANTGGDQPHNIMQPYIVLNYIIKVLDAPAIQAQVVNGYSTSSRDSYSCNYVNELSTYSTDEIRVGTWIDGKPIYRKVFNRGNNLSSFNHNIANVDLIWIDSAHSIRKHLSGNVFNIVGGTNDSAIKLVIYVNDTEVYIDNIGGLAPSEIYIALEYTKTTD